MQQGKKLCPRCTAVVISKEERYCTVCDFEHQAEAHKRKQRHQIYDATKRDKQQDSIYKDRRWKPTKAKAKRRDHGLCVVCVAENMLGFADIGHHIVPVEEAPELAFDADNVASVCVRHHAAVHAEYDASTERKKNMVNRLKELTGTLTPGGGKNCVIAMAEDRHRV